MFGAINGMMLDMLAAIARKDYENRRKRQPQGIAKAMADGLYGGRPEGWALLQRDTDRHGLFTGNGREDREASV